VLPDEDIGLEIVDAPIAVAESAEELRAILRPYR
jgi:hypothetical protein